MSMHQSPRGQAGWRQLLSQGDAWEDTVDHLLSWSSSAVTEVSRFSFAKVSHFTVTRIFYFTYLRPQMCRYTQTHARAHETSPILCPSGTETETVECEDHGVRVAMETILFHLSHFQRLSSGSIFPPPAPLLARLSSSFPSNMCPFSALSALRNE